MEAHLREHIIFGRHASGSRNAWQPGRYVSEINSAVSVSVATATLTEYTIT